MLYNIYKKKLKLGIILRKYYVQSPLNNQLDLQFLY